MIALLVEVGRFAWRDRTALDRLGRWSPGILRLVRHQVGFQRVCPECHDATPCQSWRFGVYCTPADFDTAWTYAQCRLFDVGRTSSSPGRAWPCLWTAATGTDARFTAGCRDRT